VAADGMVERAAGVLRDRANDVTLLAEDGATLFGGLGVQGLVALAAQVRFHELPVGCVCLLQWVQATQTAHVVSLVLQAMPLPETVTEKGNPLADLLEPQLQAVVAGCLALLHESLPAAEEWGLPLRGDLAPLLLAMSSWSVQAGFQAHLPMWRCWLQTQTRAGVDLGLVLSVCNAHMDLEWALDSQLAMGLVVASWGGKGVSAEDATAPAFAAFSTLALQLVNLASLGEYDCVSGDGFVAPTPLTAAQVAWLQGALPRMADLMTTTVDAHGVEGVGVKAGPLWEQWLLSMGTSDDGMNLPGAWMHLCHMVLSCVCDPALLHAMARVCAVAADLLAEGGPLECSIANLGHPLWWLDSLGADDKQPLLEAVMRTLWAPAKPAALSLMMDDAARVMQMGDDDRALKLEARFWKKLLQTVPRGVMVWDAVVAETMA
jgi:hypothetical protein